MKPLLYFPDRLVVRLVDDETGEAVPNIATDLTLYASAKNDYHFGPPLSDECGVISMEREWVARSIRETRNFFLMDYASTIEDCRPYVTVAVMSHEDIERALEAIRIYGEEPKLGVETSASELESAANSRYEPQEVTINLDRPGEQTREVVIWLRRRPSSRS